MLTLVAAVELYDRAKEGREIDDLVSSFLESRKAISCTRVENDMTMVTEAENRARGNGIVGTAERGWSSQWTEITVRIYLTDNLSVVL
jgi:hypothetical protein